MERRQCKAKGKNVGCYGSTGEEVARREIWQMGKWTKCLGAGSTVLATRMLTSHPHTGKDQKRQRAGKGREHKGNGNLVL